MHDDVGMLLRRAGFGPTASELAAAKKAGYRATVARLMAPAGPDRGAATSPMPELGRDPFDDLPDPTTEQRAAAESLRKQHTDAIIRWWLDRMTVADHQANEKLLFFWHGHWATSIRKVGSPQFMLAQHRKIRSSPNFRVMARKLVSDPALVYWLDGQLNTKHAPNENLARELMELFMLGIGNYTEQDVKEAGRALTGWKTDLGVPETAIFFPADHDASRKKILGTTARFDAYTLVDHLAKQPACARFIAARLWFRYVSSSAPIARSTQEKLTSAFPVGLNMLRVLFEDEQFRSGRHRLVKQPVEWLIGAMRQLNIRPAHFSEQTLHQVVSGLTGLGQVPFAPQSVGGWPSGAAWLNSAAAQVRLGLADLLAGLAEFDHLTAEGLATVLAIDTWTNRTYQTLKQAKNPRQLLILGLASPEYLVN
ncbi:Uncharacterized conserved protein, DUF1800 family [Micromonospora echinaurantiaca]|uniref:Uncharacterized conserved protein, DUF1800 family n=1 Tax=Micromonospora echinaurantiaca TaxID=47857 RepID=A0A1C5JNI2_9ACTN|nr:DUF1800 domain-containing protein [Micromonospora echinaurantiaca]SCG72152.1 Uncharacterized conserved protein, DUF1800 family [Micromonospora echinaurantiaca]